MGRRSSIEGLPDEVRAWLDRALATENFSGYQQLEALLRERGYAISKSAIHRYGQKLDRRLAAIRASTEAARLLADSSPDDKDVRSEALTALIQSELFETIVNLQEASEEEIDPADRVKLLSGAAKNIATLTRASVNLKKFQAEAEERARKALLEEQRAKLAEMGADGVVTDDTMAAIRRKLGIEA
ncbi:DUF3486 family protein [Roseospirillum parvum]|uniref:Phage terminase, small subunit n=1 Tax=Roseospirillum parvum TaxID=83401 RepID=A0A1G8GGF8_9PROT|nr:DUF3486 family protein [Roseospirillum parvum]SDH93431.1 Protein of unknown function [Roseospirillum parvum]